MNRCKICDKLYQNNFISHFLGEGYCNFCEVEIMICIMEMEEWEEIEDDDE